ncbi:MAG TPA: ThuA domain-containing protein, partial [Verrucomicrobiota bacterium]|nr:ThuA domain-containing protein [Verrucomicrobiota bacterium]
ELYSALVVTPGVDFDILVTGKTTFKGREGLDEPLAITLDYGKGRVFHQFFGHDKKALEREGVIKLIQRGSEWAATGSVE